MIRLRPTLRYAVSGLVAAAAHFCVMTALIELVSIGAVVASGIGFAVAIAVNYILQYRWVFESAGNHLLAFRRYVLVTVAMMAFNLAVFSVFIRFGLHYLIAQTVATGMVASINYCVNRNYTFRAPSASV
jgi:putative flippase GtrA